MKATQFSRSSLLRRMREFSAILCIGLMIPQNPAFAVPTQSAAPASDAQPATLPADQLDSLVSPIALYPDPMLTQVLMASTYPLEIIQLQQWLAQNKNLKDKALADAVQKQDWDPSVQALAGLPEVVKLLAENIKWTTDLGNAFLAQQDDVMAAVQRMRKKAEQNGNLKSNEQQKVETKTVESKQVIVIQQANPQVVYVPSYNPTVVYGAPVYAYPPIAYPPPGYYAAGMAISFGVGVAMGAFWSGGWCCGCGWGGGNNNVYINNNNNFNRNYNRQNVNNINRGNRVSTQPAGGRSNWQHNPQHRGGTPYSDRQLANKYGGTARGDSLQNRQTNARQNQNLRANQQPAGGRDIGNRGSGPSAGTRDVANRGAGPSAGTRDVSSRGPSAGTMDRGNRGGERVGNQSVPRNTPSSTNRSAFGGAGSGMSGSQARASSARGSSSFGGSRSGGGRRR
jgi:hypothetical protein